MCPLGDGTGPFSPVAARVAVAARVLGCSADGLGRLLASAHDRREPGPRRDAAGRILHVCCICGARVLRRGYRAWVDTPVDVETLTARERVVVELTRSLAIDGSVRGTLYSHYFDRRADARAWAHEAYQLHRGALEKRERKG